MVTVLSVFESVTLTIDRVAGAKLDIVYDTRLRVRWDTRDHRAHLVSKSSQRSRHSGFDLRGVVFSFLDLHINHTTRSCAQ